jgi:sugar/nucleoside kinase (ribokinase family)
VKILVIGEINVDLILQNYQAFPELGKEVLVRDSVLTLGSSSAICAVGLARLGEDVSFLGKVGPDVWGEFCCRRLQDERIDISRVIVDPAVKTGITTSITGETDRALVTYLGAISELRAGEIDAAVFHGFDHLHMAAYFMQTGLRPGFRSIYQQAKAAGLTTSLDTGFDPDEKWGPGLAETLDYVDVFFPNEVELRGIAGQDDLEEALVSLQNGHTMVVAKLGRQGAMALVQGRLVRVPAPLVEPVDTTGAGDSFNAGFLHRWLAGQSVEAAMQYGSACGAISTLALGGTGCQPGEAEVEEFLRSRQMAQETPGA